jgi:hypothetical protein
VRSNGAWQRTAAANPGQVARDVQAVIGDVDQLLIDAGYPRWTSRKFVAWLVAHVPVLVALAAGVTWQNQDLILAALGGSGVASAAYMAAEGHVDATRARQPRG